MTRSMSTTARSERFNFGDLRGEVLPAGLPPDVPLTQLEPALRRVLDPGSAEKTLHWGRNYIYRSRLTGAPDAAADQEGSGSRVVVKQFRAETGWKGLRRRWTGTKAELSWRMARAFADAGIPTAEPVLLAESTTAGGPGFFVTRDLGDVLEARYLLRAVNAGTADEDFPQVDVGTFLDNLGALLRRMHEAGLWHRDLSIGNVLLGNHPEGTSSATLYIIDLNRARQRRRLTLAQRTSDLCRLALERPEHQGRFLRAYWGEPTTVQRFAYQLYRRSFLGRIGAKKQIRGGLRSFFDLFRRRTAHAHIPPAPEGASARDKIVWDTLSDQPHQHAGRWEKLGVRLGDFGSHAVNAVCVALALPAIWRRYRHLQRRLQEPSADGDSSFTAGIGVCLRPWPEHPQELLSAVDDLGVRKLLLRLHPWDDKHDAELELAAELYRRGYELAFALPQNRELVRDSARWRTSIERLGRAFRPYGRHFQVGQAVNRSKWGIWSYREYIRLYQIAAEVLRGMDVEFPEPVELMGPAVIDFEYHATAALLRQKAPGFAFDIVSSLLYVDRRGAPENRQVGLDTVDKVVLLKAVADCGRNVRQGPTGARSWITEVNWPLWEGPHSPAGKEVSVDEESQANFLVRYYILALATGMAERVYWWQIAAKGYGLIDPSERRRRPAFHALATLHRQLEGLACTGPLPAPPDARLYGFRRRADGNSEQKRQPDMIVGWSVLSDGAVSVELPCSPPRILDRDGEELDVPGDARQSLRSAPRYFCFD